MRPVSERLPYNNRTDYNRLDYKQCFIVALDAGVATERPASESRPYNNRTDYKRTDYNRPYKDRLMPHLNARQSGDWRSVGCLVAEGFAGF